MNSFDLTIIHAVNGFARQSSLFDAIVHGFANNYLLKSLPLVVLVYFLWFSVSPDAQLALLRRSRLLVTLFAATAGPLLAKLFSNTLPFRHRPMHEAALNFTMPLHMDRDVVTGWSSFPSDTTAILFPLATGIFMVSRRLGIMAFALATMAAFARVYSGLHYPTDVLTGALLGIVAFFLLDATRLKPLLTQPCFKAMAQYPGWFYAAFFIYTHQVANTFSDSFVMLKYGASFVLGKPL